MEIDSPKSKNYNDTIKLSPVGILAFDIIIKEFTNVYHSMYSLHNDIYILLCDISDYLMGRESYSLTYTSKKAIDIIKLEFINAENILQAIKNHINPPLDEPSEINNRKRQSDTIHSIDSKKLKK